MAQTLFLQSPISPLFTCNLIFSSKKSKSFPPKSLQSSSRRSAAAGLLMTALLATQPLCNFCSSSVASAFDFGFIAPDQTLEEAESGVEIHAQGVREIKGLIDLQRWREAQKALRESSSFLKQDIYTIIQAKPGSQRPQLRKLYSKLFNSVSRLDYAARSKDAATVGDCYNTIVETLNEIFALI